MQVFNSPTSKGNETIWISKAAHLAISSKSALDLSGQIFQITHPRHIVIMERVKQLAAHLAGTSGVHALEVKRPDDVVITLAIRSPLCKAKKGGFKDAR